MKVSVVRSGGIAGLTRSWEVSIEGRDDQDSWLEIIDRLPWDENKRERTTPDSYNYRIECSTHSITLPERELTGPWRELVDRVQQASD